ncbi:DUF4265 domain-containing protein [Kribbella italica]|uniref:DUF4265 domain-containing protein n=1 Tax=Kribbella italica TaxID=1540520 RepID=A0A7W9MWX9_9ACTN|nr:DUF4265 domain-containing protein [Kribbella italica]MBB5838488.1 hypothetical protein [Kribbella italica]
MSSKYVLHANPIWRERANFIINAPIVTDGEIDGRFEQLWVNQEGDSFELCCIPFFIYDLALGDLVSVSTAPNGAHEFAGVIRPSGRYLFRVWFGDVETSARETLTRSIQRLPVLVEWHSNNLLAIDVEHSISAQELADLLSVEEQAGRLVYETGAQ